MRKSLSMLIGLVAFASLGAGTASAEVLVDQDEAPFADVRSDRYIVPPTSPTMDIRAADDFTVPAGETWTLNQIAVFGSFELVDEASQAPPPPPPSELYVTIYANEVVGEFSSNVPGAIVYDSVDPLPATGGPNYVIALPNVPLAPGRYWISVQQADAQYFNNDFQFTQQWLWDVIPFDFSDSSNRSTLIQSSGALTPGCEEDEATTWKFWTCDDEQQGEGFAAAAGSSGGELSRALTPRGGPPPVDSRMLVSGTRSGPSGTTTTPGNTPLAGTAARKKRCKGKRRVLRRGKCVTKKQKAKVVDPGFTG